MFRPHSSLFLAITGALVEPTPLTNAPMAGAGSSSKACEVEREMVRITEAERSELPPFFDCPTPYRNLGALAIRAPLLMEVLK